MSQQHIIGILIHERWRINNLGFVASRGACSVDVFLGIDLYFVGTKLFLAYIDTMLDTNAGHGEDPFLRWVFEVAT
jgi:hypothetical protein